MKWTKLLPAEPGWYWWKRNANHKIVLVVKGLINLYVCEVGTNIQRLVSEQDGEWTGPVEIPEERMKRMKWTTVPPTEPGWYWLRQEGLRIQRPDGQMEPCICVVSVYRQAVDGRWPAGTMLFGNGYPVSWENREWWGPIEVPG